VRRKTVCLTREGGNGILLLFGGFLVGIFWGMKTATILGFYLFGSYWALVAFHRPLNRILAPSERSHVDDDRPLILARALLLLLILWIPGIVAGIIETVRPLTSAHRSTYAAYRRVSSVRK